MSASISDIADVMDEFYHDWRIRIDESEGGGVMVFAPKSNYGTPIIAETPGEGLKRAIAYIDRQIAPQVSIVRAAVEEEARNYGLDYSRARKRVGV
ncbi:hypothetical protein [Terrihabitans soli]|uniref:hypothetical protein n=1 Tax=Terrihabitans soli TaxID=708113 RepID=UPI001CA31C3C|nr:hypothetical protein [Terrihabitans soli]